MPGSVATNMRAGMSFSGRPVDDFSWMLQPEDVAEAVAYLVYQPANAHVSRVEMRPSVPNRKRGG
jgi:NADP-dependent 3-hydroxy acid dehydrogenase YdfG